MCVDLRSTSYRRAANHKSLRAWDLVITWFRSFTHRYKFPMSLFHASMFEETETPTHAFNHIGQRECRCIRAVYERLLQWSKIHSCRFMYHVYSNIKYMRTSTQEKKKEKKRETLRSFDVFEKLSSSTFCDILCRCVGDCFSEDPPRAHTYERDPSPKIRSPDTQHQALTRILKEIQ